MEDALVQAAIARFGIIIKRLNPCFNGRCTRTLALLTVSPKAACLNPCFNGRCTRTPKS